MNRLSAIAAVALLLGCSPTTTGAPSARAVRANPSAAIVPACGDLLARIGKKPAQARFIGCTFHPDLQGKPLRATYAVAGEHAAAVEADLIRTARLNPLKRSCCQWDSAPASFGDGAGGIFFIAMISDQTADATRETWPRIANFRITVDMLTDEI